MASRGRILASRPFFSPGRTNGGAHLLSSREGVAVAVFAGQNHGGVITRVAKRGKEGTKKDPDQSIFLSFPLHFWEPDSFPPYGTQKPGDKAAWRPMPLRLGAIRHGSDGLVRCDIPLGVCVPKTNMAEQNANPRV